MINAFNVNDITQTDELSISVYSDVVGQMFKCGEYSFSSGDIVDFKDLVVPCNEVVIVTLAEHDSLFNDGHTVLIPCRPNSQQTVDLIVPKDSISQNIDFIQNVISAMEILNKED